MDTFNYSRRNKVYNDSKIEKSPKVFGTKKIVDNRLQSAVQRELQNAADEAMLNKSIKFTLKDGERHTLYVENDKLMVASEPQEILWMIESLQYKHPDLFQVGGIENAKDKIQKAAKEWEGLHENWKKLGKGHSGRAAIEASEKGCMDTIADSLKHFMVVVRFVEKGVDDYEIDWLKPALKDYPTIYLGPHSKEKIPQFILKSYHDNVLTSGPDLKKAGDYIWNKLTASERSEWASNGYKVERYHPTQTKNLPFNENQLGINPIYQVQNGLQWQMTDPGSTTGGKILKDILEKYGFDFGKEGLDCDHIMERQLGGPDQLDNLWPLDANINQASGAWLNKVKVKHKTFTDFTVPFLLLKRMVERLDIEAKKQVNLEICIKGNLKSERCEP